MPEPKPRPSLPPEIEREAHRRADSYFELDQLHRKPSVIFEYGGFKEFSTSVWNSKHRAQLEKAIADGTIQLTNHDMIEQMSETHSRFHAALHDMKVRVPLTVVRFSKPVELVVPIGQSMPKESALWVKKVSFDPQGRQYGHRGAGVSFVVPKSKEDIIPTHDHEFYQQFVVPPDDYLRDIRVFVVGDKIVPGYVRRATKPLTKANYDGMWMPDKEQFVTAEHPGSIEPLEGKLKEKVVDAARDVREALVNRILNRRPEWAKQGMFGFGSIDFLLDANGDPVVSEFDTGPEIRDVFDLPERLGREMAEHLVRKAGKDSTIRVFGDKDHPFVASVLRHLQDKLPTGRIMHKPSLHNAILSGD